MKIVTLALHLLEEPNTQSISIHEDGVLLGETYANTIVEIIEFLRSIGLRCEFDEQKQEWNIFDPIGEVL